MDRLEERRKIAAQIEAVEAAQRAVNDNPAVIAARAKLDKARAAADAANAEFRRIFGEHYPSDDLFREGLLRDHPDLKILGGDDNPGWIVRCCVTGLPIFETDAVIERGGEEDYERTFVLKDCVAVDATLCLPPPKK